MLAAAVRILVSFVEVGCPEKSAEKRRSSRLHTEGEQSPVESAYNTERDAVGPTAVDQGTC